MLVVVLIQRRLLWLLPTRDKLEARLRDKREMYKDLAISDALARELRRVPEEEQTTKVPCCSIRSVSLCRSGFTSETKTIETKSKLFRHSSYCVFALSLPRTIASFACAFTTI